MKIGTARVGGRAISYRDAGDPEGFPVVYHHGTPSSGHLHPSWISDAERQGIRLLGYDRAGYGDSDRHAGRIVADVAGDVVALLDHLDIERFGTWGISGGGPHALACAALLRTRCVAAASFASVAPFGAANLDWFAGMGEENVAEFSTAARGEAELRKMLEEWRPMILGGTVEDMIESMSTVLSPVDVDVLSGDLASFMVEGTAHALRDDVDGWLDDDLAFVKPWGFELTSIEVPVLLWQGAEDLMVPFAHGKWLSDHIAGVTPKLHPEEGHLTMMMTKVSETHSWLLSQRA